MAEFNIEPNDPNTKRYNDGILRHRSTSPHQALGDGDGRFPESRQERMQNSNDTPRLSFVLENNERPSEHEEDESASCRSSCFRVCSQCFSVTKEAEKEAQSDEDADVKRKVSSPESLTRTTSRVMKSSIALHLEAEDFSFPFLTRKYLELHFGKLDLDDLESSLPPNVKANNIIPTRKVFRIFKQIRKNQYSNVYSATLRGCYLPLWLKVVENDQKPGVSSIINEIRCLRWLKNTPYIVQCSGYFQTRTGYYLVLYAKGKRTLLEVIKSQYSFTIDATRFYSAELICALAAVHDFGITNRSLNLETVMLDERGHLLITDFSFAVFESSTYIKCMDPMQVNFLAPEQVKNEPYSMSVDWWAVGVIAFCMLYGEFPFAGSSKVEVLSKIAEASPVFTQTVKNVKAVAFCKSLLTKAASKRLGHGPKGYEAVKSHVFFDGMSWSALQAQKVRPPLNPDKIFTENVANDGGASVCDAASSVSFSEWQHINNLIQVDSLIQTDREVYSLQEVRTDLFVNDKPSEKTEKNKISSSAFRKSIDRRTNPSRLNLMEDIIKDLDTVKEAELEDTRKKRRSRSKSVNLTQLQAPSGADRKKMPPVVSKKQKEDRFLRVAPGMDNESYSSQFSGQDDRVVDTWRRIIQRAENKVHSLSSEGST